MSCVGGRHDNVTLAQESIGLRQFSKARVSAADYAHKGIGIKWLPAQVRGCVGERADREIGLSGLKPHLDLARVERHRLQSESLALLFQVGNYRRHQSDHADLSYDHRKFPLG
jgi:hypothetical protein